MLPGGYINVKLGNLRENSNRITDEISSELTPVLESVSSLDWNEILSNVILFAVLFFGYLVFAFITAVVVVRVNKRSKISLLIRSNFFVFPCAPFIVVVLLAYSPLTLTRAVSKQGAKVLKSGFEHASGAPLLQKRLNYYNHAPQHPGDSS